jgi:SAM-dependent methyltransferase
LETSTRKCAICQSNEVNLLHNQKFNLQEKSVLPSEYNVVSCSHCGFCYADTSASQEKYDLYYNQMSKYEDNETASGGGTNVLDKKRLETAANIIAIELKNKNASILDVGCANGGLLNSLSEKGFINLTGVDITQVCVNNVVKEGHKAFFGGIFNLENLGENKFDLIIISHVMEHICNLKDAVLNLKNLVSENGFIYVEVPDASRYNEHFIVPYYFFDCEHINHFDKNSLSNLFTDKDFQLINVNERQIEVSQSIFYPVVSCVFQKKSNDVQEVKFSDKVRSSIQKFVKFSSSSDINNELKLLMNSKEKIAVWGAGMYTLRMLNDSVLSNCNISAFLDKDSNKQGNKINNTLILEPSEFLRHNLNITVVISSALHGKVIEEEIRNIDQNLNRKVITL